MAASMRPCDYWALTHHRLHSLTKRLLSWRAKDAGLDIVTRDGGALRPLPQRRPVRVKKFSSSLLIVDDVAELLQVHRIEIVRADIENPVIDHPEFLSRPSRTRLANRLGPRAKVTDMDSD